MLRLYLRYLDLQHALGGNASGPLRKFREDQCGATAIEYGLIVGGVALAIMALVFTIGGQITDTFEVVEGNLRERLQ
jgi:pilus assembly protein Flp/PilA